MESDGDDLTSLQILSGVIMAVAAEALKVVLPGAADYAQRLRSEVNNLISLIGSLDADDRLVVDTLHFTPQGMREQLAGKGFYEISRRYSAKTYFTAFDYRIHFRVIQP